MFDITIVGAGVIGCSIAREISKYDLSVCVVDKADDVGSGTSKANSAIVHAGFDARTNSLKGKLNAEGNAMFDQLSKELDFPFKRIGALVLCFDEKDIGKLYELKAQGELNGVKGLFILTGDEVREREPNITDNVVAALYAPTSGIVCPYEMTIALAENAYTNGVTFKLNSEVKSIIKENKKFVINTNIERIESEIVINAAGIYADDINNMVSKKVMHIIPRKGEYCLFDKAVGNTVSSTIFQLPNEMGKGVLVTPTVDGNLLVGPNAVDIEDKSDISTSSEGLEGIIKKAKLSIREIPMRQLITSFSGLRAHSTGDDFIIGEADDAENFINAAGIESPGLSSAPAIAYMVSELICKKLNPKVKGNFIAERRGIPKFREMDNEERRKLIEKRPEYGKIICRCEVVTEGEIIDSIRRPLGATSLDGVKRRTRAGMGRCQSGFCSPRVLDILSRELKTSLENITKFGGNSKILVCKNKENIS